MSETQRQEPSVDSPQQSPATIAETVIELSPRNRGAAEATPADQLNRIEEKTARIEEKFARNEAVFARAQDSLERSAARVEAAARNVDAAELAGEVAALRARVNQTPRFGTLLLGGLVTTLATTLLVVLVLRFMPGLIR